MTNSNTFDILTNAPSSTELLNNLKDLKNGVIGNTWKKVEVAEDERLLGFLLSLLEYPPSSGAIDLDIALELTSETAVIIGALANVGVLTLQPLLLSSTPSSLITLITSLTRPSSGKSQTQIPQRQLDKILPHLLRALRNILVSTADMVWGHMWGVGAEKKVVGTGLIGSESMNNSQSVGKGKQVVGKGVNRWKGEASRALELVFQPDNLSTLLSLLESHSDPQILLPLYQLLSRLVALPSHRLALLDWSSSSDPSPSAFSLSSSSSTRPETPFIVQHLITTILSSTPSSKTVYPSRKPNIKLIEASLELLAALVKGQPSLSIAIRQWDPYGFEESMDVDRRRFEFIGILAGLITSGPTSARIAAASCLTNIIKADKGTRMSDRIRSTVINYQLLEEIIKLLQTEGLEERVKLCFILAALVSDDAALQKTAADKDCPARLISILLSINQDEEKGEIGTDLASRCREATLLALASLAMQHDSTRTLISDHSPPVLPHLLKALSSPSYGVRAAACQLARALSRSVGILRTSILDSGIGEEIIKLLKREIEANKEYDIGEDIGDRIWTVEVAATATICNLITDFSPVKAILLRENGLELLCDLTKSPFEPLALNAMWAIKNLTYHAMDMTKGLVTSTLGWDRLKALMSSSTTRSLRIQAFEITQNLFADLSISEITKMVDSFGEHDLFELIIQVSRESEDIDLRIPAIFVLSNIALGNEKVRNAIVGRVEILEILSAALNSSTDPIKIPTLRTLRHLIESRSSSSSSSSAQLTAPISSSPTNSTLTSTPTGNMNTNRISKPRQQMIEIFQPYQLKYKLKELIANSTCLDVVGLSTGLLDILERERNTSSSGATSSGGR